MSHPFDLGPAIPPGLQQPREIIFAFVMGGGIEDRSFAFLRGETPIPVIGQDIRISLPPGDLVGESEEAQRSCGWWTVRQSAIDYVDGSLWFEVHPCEVLPATKENLDRK